MGASAREGVNGTAAMQAVFHQPQLAETACCPSGILDTDGEKVKRVTYLAVTEPSGTHVAGPARTARRGSAARTAAHVLNGSVVRAKRVLPIIDTP
jgi:hypothetical protein